jgi:hypothetical protein
MKLSELITHTSDWTGIQRTVVESHARYLREAGLLTSGGRGLAAPDMTDADKIRLLISVCGVSIASAAPVEIRKWLRCERAEQTSSLGFKFSFYEQRTLPAALLALSKADLHGGELTAWRRGDRSGGAPNIALESASITVSFEVDSVRASIELRREFAGTWAAKEFSAIQNVDVSFMHIAKQVESYRAKAQFICRLSEANLVGWGQCLRD